MEIRRLGARDVALALRAVALGGGPPPREEQVRAFLDDARNLLVTAVEGCDPVGMLWGHVLDRPEGATRMALLYSIDVREDRRRRGIGRALIAEFRRDAAAAGAATTWLVTNESSAAAMALYRSAGGRRPAQDDVVWDWGRA